MSLLSSGSLSSITLGNLSLSSANPTISSTSTTTDFTIQTASTGSQLVFKSQGETSFTLNGDNITTPTTSLINAGEQIIFRTLGADANISATTSGTHLNFSTAGAGQELLDFLVQLVLLLLEALPLLYL